MNNTIAIATKKELVKKDDHKTKSGLLGNFEKSASLLLIAAMFVLGNIVALLLNVPVKSVMSNYSYDVLVILIIMELFTNLIAETGIMQLQI